MTTLCTKTTSARAESHPSISPFVGWGDSAWRREYLAQVQRTTAAELEVQVLRKKLAQLEARLYRKEQQAG